MVVIGKVWGFSWFFSEYALIKYRVLGWSGIFIALCELPLLQLKGIDPVVFGFFAQHLPWFSEQDAQRIKDIESVIQITDVKAAEYSIKENDQLGGLEAYKEFIHFWTDFTRY